MKIIYVIHLFCTANIDRYDQVWELFKIFDFNDLDLLAAEDGKIVQWQIWGDFHKKSEQILYLDFKKQFSNNL